MTSKQHRHTNRRLRNARESVDQAHVAVRQLADDSSTPVEIDPASELFFEFAAPLLLTARSEAEFQSAASIAEFVWAATSFDAATQALMLADFIGEAGISDEMIPWLLDVFAELADRKVALLGG
ncbi:MAG TPA: hypothetical protein PLR44_11910 [Thermomicrobiales bacterium]|nr:hypothetical protein [Thermomicrobiales bacterium]HRA32265.1 hypothetical protein [Thermomicrobiales bacterium]